MLTIKMGRRHSRHEELRAVRVGSRVGHRKQERLRVVANKLLVVELFAVDGLAASAVSHSEITALNHKVFDNTMKLRVLVVKRLS